MLDSVDEPRFQYFVKKALLLSSLTIAYNLLEGAVSIFFGVADGSVALAGFGFDSFIEVASATMVLWRFQSKRGGSVVVSLEKEKRATFVIGVLFLLLAFATFFGGSYQLYSGSHPASTVPGLIISSLSIAFMFFLYYAKRKVAIALDSSTMMKDAACSMACIKLSFILFAGSIVFLLAPSLWWADSVGAVGLSLLIAKEGKETVEAAMHPEFSGGCGCAAE